MLKADKNQKFRNDPQSVTDEISFAYPYQRNQKC